MNFKKHIPNWITLANLLAGLIAVLYAVVDWLHISALFVIIGIIFDFFDGFIARFLKIHGEFGKQLDSLADIVTSGAVPGIVMMQLLLKATSGGNITDLLQGNVCCYTPWLAMLIPLASAYRLAKFNIDTRQTNAFIGLPTPANTLLIISLPLILKYSDVSFFRQLITDKNFLLILTFLSSYLLNAEILLLSLKFKNFSWNANKWSYVFLFISVVLLVFLKFAAIPLVIFLYIVMSLLKVKIG